jgi:hypothetical protein
MTLNSHNIIQPDRFGNDWGFYIDIENVKIETNNEETIRKKYSETMRNYNDNDEYDYYIKNYNNYDDDISIDRSIVSKDCNGIINYNLVSNIVRVSSTTIITAALTYVIFFIL